MSQIYANYAGMPLNIGTEQWEINVVLNGEAETLGLQVFLHVGCLSV